MLGSLSIASSPAQSNAAVYTNLKGKETTIRLLRAKKNLLSRKTVWTLEDYQLDGRSPRRAYTALSYSWGSGTLAKSITLNGVEFYILESVHAILQTIEGDFDFSSGDQSWWWIDSVCINQDDLQERSAQVKLMGTIYRDADRTLGWFGKGSNYPKHESDDFTARGELAIQSMLLLLTWRQKVKAESTRAAAAVSLESLVSWSAIQELFQRPWWTRVWTLQEFLIPETFELWCGNSRISRETLCKVVYMIYLIQKVPGFKDVITESIWFPVWNRRRIFMWHDWIGNKLPLVALVAYGSDCFATDAKDRIYSVLDLVKGGRDRGLAQPCYNKGYLVSHAYVDFARAFIKKHNSLDIICFADIFNHDDDDADNNNPELSGLPTWAPNWAANVQSHVIPVLASQTSNRQIGNFRSVDDADAIKTAIPYQASRGREAVYRFLDGDKTLRCRGIFIDTLGDMSSNSIKAEKEKRDPLSGEEASQLLDDIARTLVVGRADRYLSERYTTGQFYQEFRAFCLAASSNSNSSSSNNDTNLSSTSALPPSFIAWFNSTHSLPVRGTYTLSEISSLSLESPVFVKEYLARKKHSIAGRSGKIKFSSRLHDVVLGMGKEFVVTESGRLGMVGRRWRAGDRVCVLLGCSIPVILRLRGNGFGGTAAGADGAGCSEFDDGNGTKGTESECYEFIGECYLEGFMDGEAFATASGANGLAHEEDVFII